VGPDVFGAVPEQELRRAGRRRRFDRGEVVFHRDDPGDSLHRVESGRFAARVITPLGDSATVSLHGPGDVFGLLAVLSPQGRRTATVVALERAETLAIPRSAFLQLRAAHPEVRDALMHAFRSLLGGDSCHAFAARDPTSAPATVASTSGAPCANATCPPNRIPQ